MSRQPLKPGDRVRFYVADGWGRPARRVVGTITEVFTTMGTVKVASSSGTDNVPAANVRKLRKKEKRERVELYAIEREAIAAQKTREFDGLSKVRACGKYGDGDTAKYVHLTELFPGERPLSRKDVERAYNEAFSFPANSTDPFIGRICKALFGAEGER